jgi:hypothetical protein
MGHYKLSVLGHDPSLVINPDDIFVNQFLETRIASDELARIFDIPDFPTLFRSKCDEFVSLYQDEPPPSEQADSCLSFIIQFFASNQPVFDHFTIDLGFFETSLIDSGVFPCLLNIFECARIDLLESSLVFIGLLSKLRLRFAEVLSQGNFVVHLAALIVHGDFPDGILRLACIALVNLLDQYESIDATYDCILSQVSEIQDSLSPFQLDAKYLPSIFYQVIVHVIPAQFPFFPRMVELFAELDLSHNGRVIAICLFHMVRRFPETVFAIIETSLLHRVLEETEAGREHLMSATLFLNQLAVMSDTFESFDEPNLRNSVMQSIPWMAVGEALDSPEPAEVIAALELIEAALPEALDVLSVVARSEFNFVNEILLGIVTDGVVDERMVAVRLLARLVELSSVARKVLYVSEAFLDVAGDVLDSGILPLQKELINLVRNLLNVEVVQSSQSARFAASMWTHQAIGAGFMELHESEDEELRVEAMVVWRKVQMGKRMPKRRPKSQLR